MAVEMKYGDYIKAAVDVVKANLVPAAVAGVLMNLSTVITLVAQVLAVVLPVLALVGLLALPVAIVQGVFIVNWMRAVKAAKHEGKPIQIADLLNFENVVDKVITGLAFGIGLMCCCVPGALIAFGPCILADRPGTSFMNAIKAALSFGKQNLVPMLLLTIICMVVAFSGSIACLIGLFITGPIGMGALYLAYEEHRSALEAAAAEGGVAL